MFDQPNSPQHLHASLESMTRKWFGEPGPWHGIDERKLGETKLPEPLRRLYRFAGYWPSNSYWETVFAYQNMLLPFESLQTLDGKLVFAVENQGCWQVGTDSTGEDPAVWVRENDPGSEWRQLETSLSRFLVTFCLHEMVFGSQHVAHGAELLRQFADAGCHISPLWLAARYVWLHDAATWREISFHLVDGRYLVMDDGWCGTFAPEPWLKHPDLFSPPAAPPRKLDAIQPMPDDLDVPEVIRAGHLQRLIRKHREAGEYHSAMAAQYEKMLQRRQQP